MNFQKFKSKLDRNYYQKDSFLKLWDSFLSLSEWHWFPSLRRRCDWSNLSMWKFPLMRLTRYARNDVGVIGAELLTKDPSAFVTLALLEW